MSARRSRANSSDNPDEDNARKKERLDCTIYKLMEKKGGFVEDDDNKSNNSLPSTSSKNNSKGDELLKIESTVKNSDRDAEIVRTFNEADFRIIPKSDILNLNYCMWENTSNVCWLDASMALLAHNQTLRYECNFTSSTHAKKIVRYFNEAICLLNDDRKDLINEERLEIAKTFLSTVQESLLEYLQPILKYNSGDPESAFCSLFNLIREDKAVRKYFEVKYTKSFVCEKCGKSRSTTINKPIITLPKVVAFQPSSPCFVSECPSCKDQEQRIQVSYKNLPKCLIFHFENGAGKGELCPLDFTLSGREYKVTGLMTLEKSEETAIDHFVTWIRDPSSDLWLECNDLNPEVLKFAAIPPNCINLDDVCMIMFESFDELGILEIKTDDSESTEKINIEDEEADDDNIPFIDLSQDNEEHNSRSNNTRPSPSKKMYGEKNVPAWNDGDDLKFLNSICNSPSNSPTKEDNDSQPDSFMKQLDLKPKTDETQKNHVTSADHVCVPSKDGQKNASLKATLSPRYTDLIMKLAAQTDAKDSKILPSSGIDPTPESMMSNVDEKFPFGQSLSSVSVEKKMNDEKLNDTICSLEDSKTSQPTVVKLVTSEDSKNCKENSQSSTAQLIESDFLMEQHDKLNQILASRKGTHSKIVLSSHDKTVQNKDTKRKITGDGNEHQNLKTDLLAKEGKSDTENISSPVCDNDVLIEKSNQAKTSDLNEKISGVFSDVPDDNHVRPPFPIEVKTTIVNVQGESKYQDSVSTFSESMPIFPVEERIQMISESQKESKSNYSIPKSPISTPPKKIQSKLEKQKDYKPSFDSSPLKLNDFLQQEHSPYNEMALIVKESEEITPENIIKVIRNEKPLTSSKSSNSLVTLANQDKKRKRKPQGKDFCNLKIKSFSINVARLTPKEILQYSPGTVFDDSSTGGSPDSTSTNKSSLSSKFSKVEYQEHFNVLEHDSNDQKPITGVQKKKGKLPAKLGSKVQSSSDEPSSSISKRSRRKCAANPSDNRINATAHPLGAANSVENELSETIQKTSAVGKRVRSRKQTASSDMQNKTNPLLKNVASSPSVQHQLTENISSPNRDNTQKPTSISPTKKRGRKKILQTEKAMNSEENILEESAENQTTSENAATMPKVPSCEVGKKWGRKEKQPVNTSADVKGKEVIDVSSALVQNSPPLPVQKRSGRRKKETELSATDLNNPLKDQKLLHPFEEVDPPTPVRKSNRKRTNTLAAMQDKYVLDSSDSKSTIQPVENLKPIIFCKQEKDSQFRSPDFKNITYEDSGLDEEIPKSKPSLRKRNYIVSSVSDSDVNTKSETLIGEVDQVSSNKKVKNAARSCSSASETELIGTGNFKSRRKRKLSNIKSEDTLSRISEKLIKDELKMGETKSNVLKITSPSANKEQISETHLIGTGVIQSSMGHVEETNESSPPKKIKTEAVTQMLTKSQMVKALPSASKRGRKKSQDFMNSSVCNLVDESGPKRMKKESDSYFGAVRNSPKQNAPVQDGTNVSIDIAGRQSEAVLKKVVTTPTKKKNLKRELSPAYLNQDSNKSSQNSLPNKKESAGLDMAIDCIIDYYLSKAYNFFGVGCEEYRN